MNVWGGLTAKKKQQQEKLKMVGIWWGRKTYVHFVGIQIFETKIPSERNEKQKKTE